MKTIAGIVLALGALNAAAAAPTLPQAELLYRLQVEPLLPGEPNPRTPNTPWLKVGVRTQTLTLYDADGTPRRHYLVSTGRNGVGEVENSLQTPRGWHRVCEKIGDGVEPDTIIFHQRITEWKYSPTLHAENPDKDWILTRILWLCGLEPGRNQGVREDGAVVDSYRRFIYIHGAGSFIPMGAPTSKGCVRMTSPEVIDLYDLVPVGTEVLIDENA